MPEAVSVADCKMRFYTKNYIDILYLNTRCPDGRTWIRSSAPPAKGSPAVILTPSACQNTIGGGLAGGELHGMATLDPERASTVFAPDTVQAPKAIT